MNKAQPEIPHSDHRTRSGLRVTYIKGEPCLALEEVQQLICDEIKKLPSETRPVVVAAQDARRIVDELTTGIVGDMDKFRTNGKQHLEEIRQTRFAMVGEVSQMTGALKELRQFFLGNDYATEIARLKEFVGLCERLQELKSSGFLDAVADTLLKLA